MIIIRCLYADWISFRAVSINWDISLKKSDKTYKYTYFLNGKRGYTICHAINIFIIIYSSSSFYPIDFFSPSYLKKSHAQYQ